MSRYDVIVIGGGVVGAAIAHGLTKSFGRIAVVDSGDRLGTGTTAAAIGGITPQSDDFCLGPLGVIAARSGRLFPEWVGEISAKSGLSIPILDTGQVQLAVDAHEAERLRDVVVPRWRAHGFTVIDLPPSYFRENDPLLTGDVHAAYLLPAEIALEPLRLMAALEQSLRRDTSTELILGTRVVSVESGPYDVRVLCQDGRELVGERTVVAAGLRLPDLLSLPPMPLFPVKGQAVELTPPGFASYPIRHHYYVKLSLGGGPVQSAYLVPRADGRLVAGVTYETGRSDPQPTDEARTSIRNGLRAVIPAAEAWEIDRHWAGVRPGIADGIPYIGEVDEYARIIAVGGHYGLGVTLAPVTARLVKALVTGAVSEEDKQGLEICDPFRFTVPAHGGNG